MSNEISELKAQLHLLDSRLVIVNDLEDQTYELFINEEGSFRSHNNCKHTDLRMALLSGIEFHNSKVEFYDYVNGVFAVASE